MDWNELWQAAWDRAERAATKAGLAAIERAERHPANKGLNAESLYLLHHDAFTGGYDAAWEGQKAQLAKVLALRP